MTEPFLNCQSLVKRFGPISAVNTVDLSIQRGSIQALLGPSGCGKTTLLRLIAGFDIPDQGQIEMNGRILFGSRDWVPPQKRMVGLVFQDYALFPHLNVESNIGFGLPNSKEKKSRIANLLEMVGLNGLGSRMPHELSGGQQQRVALARSLAPEPNLLLLDEPFSNLDPGIRAKVRSEMKRVIQSLQITTIFVTHDQEEALSMAEEVAVMIEGKVLQVGHSINMYHHPSSREVANFLGEANFLPGEAAKGYANCELGRFAINTSLQGPVEVMIRPEDIKISEDPEGIADVVSIDYYGHGQMVVAQLASGLLIKVRMLSGVRIKAGQRLNLQVKNTAVAFPKKK